VRENVDLIESMAANAPTLAPVAISLRAMMTQKVASAKAGDIKGISSSPTQMTAKDTFGSVQTVRPRWGREEINLFGFLQRPIIAGAKLKATP
jgi:hypothetical protein